MYMIVVWIVMCGYVAESATVGQSCSNTIPCDTLNSACDLSTSTCTCDYGDYAASIDRCCVTEPPILTSIGYHAYFAFNISSADLTGTYKVGTLLEVIYTANYSTVSIRPRMTFIGDAATGDISFQVHDIKEEDAGVYTMIKVADITFQDKCCTLYVD